MSANSLSETITTISTSLGTCPDDQKLKFLHDSVPSILSIINKDEATEYVKRRDVKNEEIKELPGKIISNIGKILEETKYDITLRIMSSYNARLNLIDESDIDIGVLIKDLDAGKLTNIHALLLKDGYTHTKIVNPQDEKKKYYCYEKVVDGVEIEIKVRDFDHTQIIVKLHDYLDNDLTEDERIIFTYAKFMLKSDKILYKYMKMIIYAYASYYIPNAPLLFL